MRQGVPRVGLVKLYNHFNPFSLFSLTYLLSLFSLFSLTYLLSLFSLFSLTYLLSLFSLSSLVYLLSLFSLSSLVYLPDQFNQASRRNLAVLNTLRKLKEETGDFKVLYVEDEEVTREIISIHLKKVFQQVIVAVDGKEGLELYNREGPFDIVISDISMPFMGGLEMIQAINKISPGQCTIIISGHDDSDNLLQAIEAGIDNFLLKPVSQDRLLEVLYQVVQKLNQEKKLATYTRELGEKNRELEEANGKIREGIEKARQIHARFLPETFPEVPGLSFGALYLPAWNLGGDFYNLVKTRDQLLVYLVDITGHGLEGAILTIFVREVINSYLALKEQQGQELCPGEMLEFLAHRYCQENFPYDYFVCLLAGVLDLDTYRFTCCNAGFQTEPWLVDREGRLQPVLCQGPPISSVYGTGLLKFPETSFNFPRGSAVLFTTDGLVEEERDGQIFGEERLQEAFLSRHKSPPGDILEKIQEDFQQFAGNPQGTDDITLLVIKNRD